MATARRGIDASRLSQPAPQQGQAQPDHIRKTALDPRYHPDSPPLTRISNKRQLLRILLGCIY
jgi:hypothetical protein